MNLKSLFLTCGTILLLTSCGFLDDIIGDIVDKGKGDKDKIDQTLVLHYPLDGHAKDFSFNKNHGEVVGAIPTEDRFGKENGALLFDGDDKVLSDFIHILPQGNTPKTICGWMKSTDTTDNGVFTGDKMLFGIGAPSAKENFQIGVALEKWRVNGWGDSNDWRIGLNGKEFFDGRWTFVAVTYDGKSTKVYFEAKLVAETDSYTFLTPEKQKVAIGVEIDEAGWDFKGALDDFRVYNRVLDDQELYDLYDAKK